MQTIGESLYGDLELLEYQRERLENLLSEGIVSAEMECQLRQKLTAVARQVEMLKAYRVPSPHRHAA
jgi:hypothetical protein